MRRLPQQGRGVTAIDGAMALIVIILIIQIWLLSATLDAYLSGHSDTAIPGAVVSGLLFAACAGLYWFVDRIEDRIEHLDMTDDNIGPFDTYTRER